MSLLPLQAQAGEDLGPIGNVFESLVDESLAASLEGATLFLVAFVAVYAVGRLALVPLVRRALETRELDAHARKPLLKLTRFSVIFLAVAIAFGFAGYGNFLVSMAGIAAAGAIVIGLAMQHTIANVVAGVFIYADEPFRIGDWIEWDDYSGVVEDISLRVTRVRTFDNELLTVPNAQLSESVIKNPVDADELRLRFVFGVGYDDDVEQAREIIRDEATDHPNILDDPEPSVRLTELGDSDVGLESRFWIADPSRSDVVRIKGEFVTAVKQRFDEAGIDIPYPVRTLEGDLGLETDRGILESTE
ncbi:mechanosensitive ion channel family protein [Natronobacterium gregoryi]|uniref:Mechanosensitive ion channel MscS n=2 Tax=Natronobacterium gregoryi TaxID=44930 RepID=L0AFE7_NATGS|nr:mechanosensitive ion channel family protein [Natronobacterium gregoryi]AFZ71872.1 small-conductance mechanosensitive channel [Natronobacterium gregoryi SP2]ELY73058.1 mechanosensitive ion channel MscS [Natronobacterium gregoryi SP2]PLK19388.1 mechanosensitive ion channel family protein [Natronobacterium gregoryi SP2]SFJ50936.1 Mechanosensitive ion channel [Natronobacterium gregoryi]